MQRKRERQNELLLASLIVLTLALTVAYVVVSIALIEASKQPRPTTQQSYEWRPDIRHCFDPEESRELWDCIRYVHD